MGVLSDCRGLQLLEFRANISKNKLNVDHTLLLKAPNCESAEIQAPHLFMEANESLKNSLKPKNSNIEVIPSIYKNNLYAVLRDEQLLDFKSHFLKAISLENVVKIQAKAFNARSSIL